MGGGEESFGNLVELEPAPPQSGGIGRRRMKTLALVRTVYPHVLVIVVVVVGVVVVVVVVEHYLF